ncbi:MAG: cyclic nucleotide-binding domain-containing protein [Candidatus Riflebacteria bacterium]|nr:cyclic nucleotide-binding domain-containing protein [Candidatus Riflebacteria bacterium]
MTVEDLDDGVFDMKDNSWLKSAQFKQFVARYKTTEVIFWEGEQAQYFYIIAEGRVEITRNRPDGNPLKIARLGPGDFFGEMAMMNNLPRSGTAVAKEPTSLLCFTQEQLQLVLTEKPAFGVKMIKILCSRLRTLDETLAELYE